MYNYVIFISVYYLLKVNECHQDTKLFLTDAKAKESVTNYLLVVEKVNEVAGRNNIIKQTDLVSIIRLVANTYLF